MLVALTPYENQALPSQKQKHQKAYKHDQENISQLIQFANPIKSKLGRQEITGISR